MLLRLGVLVGVVVWQLYLILFDANVSLLEELSQRGRLLLAGRPRLLRRLLLDSAHHRRSVRAFGHAFVDDGRGVLLRLILHLAEVVDLHLGRLKLLDLV